MSELHNRLDAIDTEKITNKMKVVHEIQQAIQATGYDIVELNTEKPWGAYFRINNEQANEFVEEFFPGLSAAEARLGNEEAELSPKVLIVAPGQRLSWQYHDRRAERWAFLTTGAYNKSQTDDPGDVVVAKAGDVVQFIKGERHRLTGAVDDYTIVAEIWQHTEPGELSDEDDIIRLADDYAR